MKDDDEGAAEEEYRTVWEQDGEAAARSGPEKRPWSAVDQDDDLPEDVQARLKALRGE
jgi:hypothetical protein